MFDTLLLTRNLHSELLRYSDFIYHAAHFLPLSSYFSYLFIFNSHITFLFISFFVFSRSCSQLTSFSPILYLLSPLPVYCSFPRLSPIWEVSEWALRAVASNRLCSLAQPQAPTVVWQPNRPPLVPVSNTHSIS